MLCAQLPDGQRKKGRCALKREPRFKDAFVPGVLVLALLGAGCGGSTEEQHSGPLQISVDADRFAGPSPLNVRFSAKPKDAAGDVHYRWRFDDGTQSDEQSPTHSFPRAGYYTGIVDARDESGNNARQSLMLGAWPPRQWAQAQSGGRLTPEIARRVQKVQQHRTDVRHADLRAALRRRIGQG
jgi:hypothetical protein